MKHRSNKPDTDYQATVDSLREMLGEGSVEDQAIENTLPGLERAILHATEEMPQQTEGSLISAEGSLLLAEGSPTTAPATWVKHGLGVLRRIGRPVPAMAMSLVLAGLIALGMQLQPNPTIVSSSSDADLTFQELWLAEDELLFSDELR